MPVSTENYAQEIAEGRNARHVKCKYCGSIILTPTSAEFTSLEFDLPLVKQEKASTETEKVSLFWLVNDMYTFHNIGFSNTVGANKYLTCADCELGPIGFHDINSKKSYVALSRVQHAS